MKDSQLKIEEILNLPDPIFFSLQTDSLMAMQSKLNTAFDDMDFLKPGEKAPVISGAIGINAPKVIDMRLFTKIPMLIGAVQSGERQWAVQYDVNSCLFITNLKTGNIYLHWPFYIDKLSLSNPSEPADRRPSSEMAGVVSSSIRLVDLKKDVVDINWIDANYSVTMVNFDWKSNTVNFNISGTGISADKENEVDRLTLYNENKQTPDQIEIDTTGIGFKISPKKDELSSVICSVNLEIDERNAIIKETPEGEKYLCVNIFMIKLDGTSPVQCELGVPFTMNTNNKNLRTVKSTFALDIEKASGKLIAGKYMSYLVIGSQVSGPFETKIK